MEQIAHNVPSNGLQLRTRATEPAASVPSSSSDEQSSGTRNPPRRRSLPASKGTKNPPAKINTSHTATKGTKAVSAGPRSGTSHGAIMQMSGTLSPAHEVTYTPTTHRISKAKKGKKVHACEFPGCTKIFTRAEHRKRHEANHNSIPLFQCDIEGCRKPFQRADLLTRHMERQHNIPCASPPPHIPPPRRSPSSISTAQSNPTTPSIVRHSIPQQPHPSLSQPMAHHPNRAMSIGSIVDHASPMSAEYMLRAPQLPQNFNDFPHLPVPTAPPLGYAVSASESPYYSDSCYSPMSDLIQPQIATQPQYIPVDRPQSASLECGFPQGVYGNPIDAAEWGFDQAPLSAPMHGMGISMARHFQYPSPTIMSPEILASQGMPYDMSMSIEQWTPFARKMTF